MATTHADWAIESFLDLERRLADFLRVVPYESAHMRTYSPVLAAILLDACSLTESILKSTMDHARYNAITSITQLRAKRYSTTPPYLNINDLRLVFRSDMFYAKKVWLLSRGVASFPWYQWRARAVQHPKWWTAYNRAKHDRFGNATHATLNNTLHALKGCYLCLVSSLEFRARLVERGLIRSRNLSAHVLLPICGAWEPLPSKETIVSSSLLFGYKFRSTGNPAEASDIGVFL